jgi:capsular polysaccharide biosynthesis protein
MHSMKIILPQQAVERKKPENYNSKDNHLFQKYWVSIRPECHIIQMNNPIIVKDTILDYKNLRFFDKYTHYNGISVPGKFKHFFFFLRNRTIEYKNAVWIFDNYSANFYHWFTECLPRLFFAEKYLKDHVVILPERFKRCSFINESLEYLGIVPYYFDPKINLKIPELIVTSLIGRIAEYQKDLLIQLRVKFGVFDNIDQSYRKVFIRRKPAKARNILNEIELILLLKEFNVEIHYFDDYSLVQQIAIMKETKTLIGLHGAGLTNMLFMPPKGNVLEFRNADDGGASTNCYFNLASEIDINYYYTTNKSTSPKTNHADFEIDLIKLRTVLKTIG